MLPSVWACTWLFFIKKLKIAQNKILRFIFYKGKFDSTYNIFLDYRLLNVYSIHIYFLLLFIFKNIIHIQRTPVFRLSQSTHSTRNNDVNLVCPQYRKTLKKIFYFSSQILNALLIDIKKRRKKNIYNTGNINQCQKKIKNYVFSF